MGFLASIFSGPILTSLINGLAGPLENIYKDYINGKISKEQLLEQIQAAMLAAFAQVETAYLDSITKTYTTFIQAASQNPVMTKAWSWVLYSQLGVLVYHQLFIPIIVLLFGIKYPSSGMTVEWSYALIALCLGAPAIASRVGPAASWAVNSLTRLVKP
jgi:hypothetical protein